MNHLAEVVSLPGRKSRCEDCAIAGECLARDPVDARGEHHSLNVVPRIVHRGDHLFRAGERLVNLYLVRSGALKTYTISANGDEQVTGFLLPGDLIGLDALDDQVHACNAEALDTSSVCPLPYHRLLALCGRAPAIQSRLMRAIGHKIRHDESLLVALGQKTADQRLATFLLEQCESRRRRGQSGREICLPMPRADIASYLALAVETVSRVLTRLQEAGVIVVRRNHIAILDAGQLAAMAGAPASARSNGTMH